MNNSTLLDTFQSPTSDAAGVLTWVHLGDLHMREAGQRNDLDLQAIVAEMNAAFADSISFVVPPGDNGEWRSFANVQSRLPRRTGGSGT